MFTPTTFLLPRFFFRGGVGLTLHNLHQTLRPRINILREAAEEGRAVSTIVREVAVFGQQHGKLGAPARPEEERIVNAEHLSELEAIAVNKIREAAGRPFTESDSLLQLPRLGGNLYRWRDWGEDGELIDWFITMEKQGLTDADLTKKQIESIQGFISSWRNINP